MLYPYGTFGTSPVGQALTNAVNSTSRNSGSNDSDHHEYRSKRTSQSRTSQSRTKNVLTPEQRKASIQERNRRKLTEKQREELKQYVKKQSRNNLVWFIIASIGVIMLTIGLCILYS